MPLINQQKQILAIINKVKNGKAKTPAKAKMMITQIKKKQSFNNWLAQ